jgi:hypothetical protein
MTVRWTIDVSEVIDQKLRAYLAEHELDERELPRFIENLIADRLAEASLFEASALDESLGKGDISGIVAAAIRAEQPLKTPQ